MINQIKLENFQSHENSELNLCNGINVITGQSDSGKSSILRSLYYSVYNRPTSNNYPSNFIKDKKGNLTDRSSVTISKENQEVVRYRSKAENGYIIGEQKLKAIGKDLPEQVSEFFNLNSVNIQKQLDSHFLLSESPGQIAKFFNDLVNFEEIDLYLTAIDSKKRECNKELKMCNADIEELQTELDEYYWIDEAEKLLNQFEKFESKVSEYENNIRAIENLIEEINELQTIADNFPDVETAENLLSELEEITQEFTELDQEIFSLENLLDTINNTNIPNLDIESANGLVKKCLKFESSISEKEEQVNDLENLIESIAAASNKISEYDISIKDLEKKLPDMCPVCGKKLD